MLVSLYADNGAPFMPMVGVAVPVVVIGDAALIVSVGLSEPLPQITNRLLKNLYHSRAM